MYLFFRFMLLSAALFPATIAAAQIETLSDYTDKTYVRDHAAFLRNNVIEPYKQHTKDRGETRQKVIQFLEAFCELQVAGNDEKDALKKLSQQAHDAGSRDPQFLAHYCYAILDKREAFKKLSGDVANELNNSPYPALTSLNLKIWQLNWYQSRKRRRALINDLKKQLLILLKENKSPNRRFIWRHLLPIFAMNTAELRNLIKAVEKADGIDPWLKSMFIGQAKHEIAWDIRGGSYSHKVPKEAWTPFYALLDEAQVEFEKAIHTVPDFPEAATQMISVSLEQSEPKKSPRHWFDRATAAQIDWTPAYKNLLRTMLPKWGGNAEQMVELGLECAKTERFDTRAPWQLMTCIIYSRDKNNNENILENEKVYQATKKVCQAYTAIAAKQGDFQSVRKYESYLAAAAFLANKHEDTVSALQRIDNQIDNESFDALRVTGQGLLGRSITRVSPAADLCKKMKELMAQGDAEGNDFADKIRQLEEIRDQVPSNGKLYVDILINQGIAALAYESGQWADVPFEAGLVGWLRGGDWDCEPSTNSVLFTGNPKHIFPRLLWSYPVEPPYAVEVKIEIDKDSYFPGDKAGVLAGDYGYSQDKGAFLCLGGIPGFAGYIDNDNAPFLYRSESTKVRRLRVHVWKGFHAIMVNNRFCKIVQDDDFDPTGNTGLSVGFGYRRYGHFRNTNHRAIRFSDFRIRKLNIGPPTERIANNFDYWNQWVIAEPDNSHALARRGIVRGMKSADNLDAAIEDLTASVNYDPHAADTFLKLGAFYEEKAQFAKAKDTYLKAIKVPPNIASSRLLATLEASCSDETLRNGESALKRAMDLKKLYPDDSYHDTLVANAWATVGDFDKAIQWQTQALKLDPENQDNDARRARLALYRAGKPFFYPPGPRTVVKRSAASPPPQWTNPVITKGLIARWPFDSDVKETINQLDSQTCNGLGKFQPKGKVDQSLYLNNATHVTTPDFADFSREDCFSYGGWIYPAEVKNGAICSRLSENRDTGHALTIWKDSIEFHLLSKDQGTLKIKAKPKVVLTHWQHVFATYDGSGKAAGAKIYINGKQVKTAALKDNLTGEIRNDAPFNIGLHSNWYRYHGAIDELRVYDRVLSPTEVAKVAAFGNTAITGEQTSEEIPDSAPQTPTEPKRSEPDETKATQDKVK